MNSTNKWLTRVEPSSKEHFHGGVISSLPTPVASGEGVDWGQCGWVLTKKYKPAEKNLDAKLNDFIIVYTSYSTYNTPKMMVSCFPHASRSMHLPSILPSVAAACFWLVVVFQISIGGCIGPRRIFVFIFVQCSVHHITPRSCVLPNIPPTVITDLWLVVASYVQTVAT